MLDFLSRLAAINAPMPVVMRAPIPALVTVASETVAYARVAPVTDLATIIADMDEWCGDVHDIPVTFTTDD